jgi:hypothetical protein
MKKTAANLKKAVVIFYGATLLLIAVIIGVTGCGDDSSGYNPNIDPNNFVDTIDNTYFTMTPGTTFNYEGETEDGTETIVVYVTSETREVMGVTCVVVWDRVYLDGELIENTYDWFAQDNVGNVWYFGEDSEELEEGEVVSTEGSWEAGVDGALPGIVMPADPIVGQSYRQEYYAGIAEDMGQILALNETVTVPYGTFDDCLQTKDWTPLEPGVIENKYYSAAVGWVVMEEVVLGGDEVVELISVTTE